MKKVIFLGVIYLAVISSCAKNEADLLNNTAKTAAVEVTAVTLTIPDIPGYTPKPGIEPGNPIPYPDEECEITPGGSTTNYGNPSIDYLEGTTVFNISQLEEGSTYHQINNDNLNMAFYSGDGDKKPISVRRLTPTTASPYGWTPYWNTLDLVEQEHPEVLFAPRFERAIIIVLSKPCVKFGFELAPNLQNQLLNCAVFWGNAPMDSSRGAFDYQIKTPSGAALYSIEEEGNYKFTVITILIYPPGNNPIVNPEGLAMANIRYKLAK